METQPRMRNIWFFVGVILSVIGLLVLCAGVYDLFSPPAAEVRLADLHANIWWGIVILLGGVIYVVKNRNGFVEG